MGRFANDQLNRVKITHPLCAVRVNPMFNCVPPVSASIYCSPRHPSALQIDPLTGDGLRAFRNTRTKEFSRQKLAF
jgi:hypothetical protein